jgi:hypothetical protein
MVFVPANRFAEVDCQTRNFLGAVQPQPNDRSKTNASVARSVLCRTALP